MATYGCSGLTVKSGETVSVSFTVRNSGKRAGTEIAQVYASLPDAAGEPPKRLIGWARVELAPGESKQVSVPVDHDRVIVYDEASDTSGRAWARLFRVTGTVAQLFSAR